MALLRHGKNINRRSLLLYAIFCRFRAVFVQSNHIGAQSRLEEIVLNKKNTPTEHF